MTCSGLSPAKVEIIAVTAYKNGKEHNKNSVKPIVQIKISNYDNDIYVAIINRGVGPAIIDKNELINSNMKNLVDLFKDEACLEGAWIKYNVNSEGTALPPGDLLDLLRMKELSTAQLYVVRKKLAKESISVIYHDVYDERMETRYPLEFFGSDYTDRKLLTNIETIGIKR